MTLESIAQDVRFAIRALARSGGVTATAVLNLAVGVAATTAIFGSIVSGYVLGAAAAYWLSRAVAGRLPGIADTAPLMLTSAEAVVAVVGLAACLIPALRAARANPVVALWVE